MGLFSSKEQIGLKVDGMTCQNCVGHVTKALQGCTGTKKVEVDLEQGKATVWVAPGSDPAPLLAAVDAAGYTASIQS